MLINIVSLDAIMFTLFRCNILKIKDYLSQRNDFQISSTADINPILNLEYAYNPNPARAVFLSLDSDNTIMFPCLQDGWNSLVYKIASYIKCDTYYLQIMDCDKILEPVNYLQCYSNGSCIRVVYALKEDRWVFYEEGKPMDFEVPEYYSQRIKKKKLNKRILLEYCTKLGLLKEGFLRVDEKSCFTLESYWAGKFAGSSGFGSTSLRRK